jgi:hypothetical protein
MLKLQIYSYYTYDKPTVIEITDKDSFQQLYRSFPQVKPLVDKAPTVAQAARDVAEYISNHNLEASVIDPDDQDGMDEEISDPNDFDEAKMTAQPKSLDDIREALEAKTDVEFVDIPEALTTQGATHRWDQQHFGKSEDYFEEDK